VGEPEAPKPEGDEPESLSQWLALRQPADFAARSTALTELIADRLADTRPLRVLDLGTGTGSNIRYLAPRLGGDQQWLAVDRDPSLLAEAAARSASATGITVETRTIDLGALTSPDLFDGRHLVTASALLDLVSERWLRWVASECRRTAACALFALSYNGRNECDPPDSADAMVFDLFNRHQARDKGLGGAAAGPYATDVARRAFNDLGYDVRVEPSDWQIDRLERELQRQLIEGWASAAAETAPAQSQVINAWKQRRLDHVTAGHSRIVVGHYDMSAIRNRE
jgi:SAM-dependent methyltransferase